MKFKVGDKVRIKSTLSQDDTVPDCWVSAKMVMKRGLIYPIEGIAANGNYGLDLDNNKDYWWFTDEMLEPVKLIPECADGGVTKAMKDWADSLADDWAKLGCASFIMSSDEIKKTEEKKLKFTFYVTEGTRPDKKCNGIIPTMTTTVVSGLDEVSVTCDKVDFDERQGVLEGIAQLYCKGRFDKEYEAAVKLNKRGDEANRTCIYCGKIFDTAEERVEHEAWHVERKKARRERYLLRKRAKEIAFEEQAQKMAKEMIKK